MFDYFGRDAQSLKNKKLWLFDMDGTIYSEDRLFDDTLNLLGQIEDSGGKYIFITNNSSKSVKDYVEKVNRIGIRAVVDNFFTSVQATILYLEANYSGAKVYCQGTRSFVSELAEAGIDVTLYPEKVDVVLVGFDTELTSEKLRNTCEILSTQEVTYLATNPDLVCPVAFGFIPDCGSICSMIKNATGRTPKYIGKPEPVMVDVVRKKLGICPEDTVVVGDRLYTDIAAGLNAGVTSVCVLTGEATVADIVGGDLKPTYTFRSVGDIYKLLIEPVFEQTLSERNARIMKDLAMCEEAIRSGNEASAEKVVTFLCSAYDFWNISGESYIEKAKEMMKQLMWALRML